MRSIASLIAAGSVACTLAVAPAASAITVTPLPDGGCTLEFTAQDKATVKSISELPKDESQYESINKTGSIPDVLKGGQFTQQEAAFRALGFSLLSEEYLTSELYNQKPEAKKTRDDIARAKYILSHQDGYSREEISNAAFFLWFLNGFIASQREAYLACSKGEAFDQDIPSINYTLALLPGFKPLAPQQSGPDLKDPGTIGAIVGGVLAGVALIIALLVPFLKNLVPGLFQGLPF